MPRTDHKFLRTLILMAFTFMFPALLNAQPTVNKPLPDAPASAPSSVQGEGQVVNTPSPVAEQPKKEEVPLPECEALVSEFWNVYNSGDCRRAYEMLGPRSRELTPFKVFNERCSPQDEENRIKRQLAVKFEKNRVTSCNATNSYMPESLVTETSLLYHDPSVSSKAIDSLDWKSGLKNVTKKDLEKKQIESLQELLKQNELSADKYRTTVVKYYFKQEDNTWKIEIPHLFWTSEENGQFAKVVKLIDDGNYPEANKILRDFPQGGIVYKSYPLLLQSLMEHNRMRNSAKFSVDLADISSKITDDKVDISGNIVNKGNRPVTGIMAKVYYIDSSDNVLLSREVYLLSNLAITYPKITGQLDGNSRKPFSIILQNSPKKTKRIWMTVSGYTD